MRLDKLVLHIHTFNMRWANFLTCLSLRKSEKTVQLYRRLYKDELIVNIGTLFSRTDVRMLLKFCCVALICSLFAQLQRVECLLFENGTLTNNQLRDAAVFASKPEPSFVRLSVVFADGRQTCGGVLVSPLWIFTSASCVNRWDRECLRFVKGTSSAAAFLIEISLLSVCQAATRKRRKLLSQALADRQPVCVPSRQSPHIHSTSQALMHLTSPCWHSRSQLKLMEVSGMQFL